MSLEFTPKGESEYIIKTVFLDLNGTLAVNGKIDNKVKPLLGEITDKGVEVILLTGNQRGNADELCRELGINYRITKNTEDKAKIVSEYPKENIASIGNARIDIGMFDNSKLSIATLQVEGIHTGIIDHVDIIVPSIIDALNFLLDRNTFEGSMRK